MKNFSLKFLDIMVGIVLGLGFQWWPNLHENWQRLLFIFIYFDIIDYWIDYSPSLKKFPPKREIDVILDVSIMFALFLYIYSAQLAIYNVFIAFIIFKALDFIWLWSSSYEYQPTGTDKEFIDTWLKVNATEIVVTVLLIGLNAIYAPPVMITAIGFIVIRVLFRLAASLSYKKIHFA